MTKSYNQSGRYRDVSESLRAASSDAAEALLRMARLAKQGSPRPTHPTSPRQRSGR